MKQSVKIKV
jgi:hypothetical protein